MTKTKAAIGILAFAALGSGGCATVDQARARFMPPPSRCEAMAFPIYFNPNSDALTDPAIQAITASGNQAKRCTVAAVTVVGLADADGGAAQNLELSKRRAQTVATALQAHGFPAPAYVDGSGEAGAVTPKGAVAPGRRAAEVRVTFKQPAAK